MDETMQQQQKLGIYRIVYRRGIERKTTVFVSEDDGKVLATKRLEWMKEKDEKLKRMIKREIERWKERNVREKNTELLRMVYKKTDSLKLGRFMPSNLWKYVCFC